MKKEQTVADYVKAAPDATRPLLKKLLAELRALLPKTEESITYRIPTFKFEGSPVLYVAAFSTHCSLFPVTEPILKKLPALKPFAHGRGTLQFRPENELPRGLLKKVVAMLLSGALERKAAREAKQKKPKRPSSR